jgi:Malectin domain
VQVFDVVLNGDHTIIPDLDIFSKVGRGVAHDEFVPFSVINGKLTIKGEESEIRGGKIRVEFIKVIVEKIKYLSQIYLFLLLLLGLQRQS